MFSVTQLPLAQVWPELQVIFILDEEESEQYEFAVPGLLQVYVL